jgi:hypothetical protein
VDGIGAEGAVLHKSKDGIDGARSMLGS